MDTESGQLRLSMLGITAVCLFGALLARLWVLQVMRAPEYQGVATQNRERVIYEEPRRGRILDRNGQVLVDNRTSRVIAVDLQDPVLKDDVKRRDLLVRIAQQLTRVGIPTKVTTLDRRLKDKQYSQLTPIPLAIDIPDELWVYLAEHEDEFPGVERDIEEVRSYPFGGIAAHVLGYVGRINSDELVAKRGTDAEPRDDPKHYEPNSPYGKTGMERVYEDDLRGTAGVRTVEVDPKGRIIKTVGYTPPVPGNDVQLSIDVTLQTLAEETLAKQLDAVRYRFTSSGARRAPAGSVVLTDPRNGDVLAMASYPTYDPGEFVNGISSDRYDQMTKGPASENPLFNRAITGQYAPGSTFKLVTAYGGLLANMEQATTTQADPGNYILQKCTGNCDRQNAGRIAHGPVDMAKALTVSSDVFFYRIGDYFYWERDTYGDGIQSAARAFGFGSRTGIDLPGEASGTVPDAEWKKQLFEALPEDQQKLGSPTWYPGDNVNLAIGQGDVLSTPLQIARAYGAFVTKGSLAKPRVAMRVLKPAGDPADPNALVRSFDPVVASTLPMPDNVFAPIHRGLLDVPEWRFGGTAGEAFKGFDTAAFPLIAKTGTAQVDGKADNALFVACGPEPNSQVCLSIVLEEAGFGGETAAPIARRIFDHVSGQSEDPDYEPWKAGIAVGITD